MKLRSLPYPMVVLAIAAVYLGAAKLGLTMAFVAEQVTAVWPPTGIALAAVLLFGYRVWPGLWLGAFLANATAHEPIGTAFGIALGNTLEAVIGAWLLRRVGFGRSFERLKDVLGLVVFAVLASTMVSATIGTTSLCLGGAQPWTAYRPIWWVWWLGDAMGALVMTPVLLTWATRPSTRWHPRRFAEALILLISVVLVTVVIFGAQFENLYYPRYLVFPFVIWAALRFGQPGTTAVTFTVSVIAIWGTVHRFGLLPGSAANESLISLQLFMAVVAVSALLLGAAITERNIAEEALQTAHLELEQRIAERTAELSRSNELLRLEIAKRKEKEETVRSLLRISETLNSTLDVDTLLDALVEEAIKLANAESGCSGLRTPGGLACYKYFQKSKVLPFEYCWPRKGPLVNSEPLLLWPDYSELCATILADRTDPYARAA